MRAYGISRSEKDGAWLPTVGGEIIRKVAGYGKPWRDNPMVTTRLPRAIVLYLKNEARAVSISFDGDEYADIQMQWSQEMVDAVAMNRVQIPLPRGIEPIQLAWQIFTVEGEEVYARAWLVSIEKTKIPRGEYHAWKDNKHYDLPQLVGVVVVEILPQTDEVFNIPFCTAPVGDPQIDVTLRWNK